MMAASVGDNYNKSLGNSTITAVFWISRRIRMMINFTQRRIRIRNKRIVMIMRFTMAMMTIMLVNYNIKDFKNATKKVQ